MYIKLLRGVIMGIGNVVNNIIGKTSGNKGNYVVLYRCPYCGEKVENTTVFCPYCGRIIDKEYLNSMKERYY